MYLLDKELGKGRHLRKTESHQGEIKVHLNNVNYCINRLNA